MKSLKKLIKSLNPNIPLYKAYINNDKYYSDFINMFNIFENKLSTQDYKKMLRKLQEIISYNQSDIMEKYAQTISEFILLYYILDNDKFNNFKLEPTYSSNKNPECSFDLGNFIVNIEVKCPRYDICIDNKIELMLQDRLLLDELSVDRKKEYINDLFNSLNMIFDDNLLLSKRKDNNLKDYLKSAQCKFPDDNKCFNILIITLPNIYCLDEWFNYIIDFNNTCPSESKLENYNNVDLIILSDAICNHKKYPIINSVNVWNFIEYTNILFINPKLINHKKANFSKEVISPIFSCINDEFWSFHCYIHRKLDNISILYQKSKFIFYCQPITEFKNSLKYKDLDDYFINLLEDKLKK